MVMTNTINAQNPHLMIVPVREAIILDTGSDVMCFCMVAAFRWQLKNKYQY
jgi:hypothetical protein